MIQCEFCNAELSAGDISLFPNKDGDIQYTLICPDCDKPQNNDVCLMGGMFYVFPVDKQKQVGGT